MRLLTHNLLQCHAKGCMQNNFPLRLEHTEVHVARPPHDVDSDMITSGSGEDSSSSSSEDHEEGRVEYNRDFLINFLPKLEYSALRTAVQQLGLLETDPMLSTLPTELPEGDQTDLSDQLLQCLHRALMETRILQGQMVCNGCGHVYPIRDGIPNMLLREDEV